VRRFRTVTSQEQTDAESFDVLRPKQTVFVIAKAEYTISSEEMLIEKRNYWRNVPQMTVLLGGMRCVKHQL
jgi:catalase (peroxidase I)